jgi:hypothetical protein
MKPNFPPDFQEDDNEITPPGEYVNQTVVTDSGYTVLKGTGTMSALANKLFQDNKARINTARQDLHISGAKDDSGKPRTGLMVSGFANALVSVAEVTTYGANKYSPNGWLSVPNSIDRYTDAMYRHLLAHSSGQDKDLESNLTHLSHAAWNILALIELNIRKEPSTPPAHTVI